MSLRAIIYGMFFLPISGFAQYMSNGNNFSVDQIKGCAPLTITFTNLRAGACTIGDPCHVKFDVPNSSLSCVNAYFGHNVMHIENPDAPYTFTQPGVYRVIVIYTGGDCDEITITVTPNIPPDFNIFTCSFFGVQVQVTDTNYDNYIINFNDGSLEVEVPKGAPPVGHTYASGGSKTISVRGKDNNAADNCTPANTKAFTALLTLPPPSINELEVISNTQIDFDFTIAINVHYRLEIATNNNTTFQVAQTVYNSSTALQSNLQTSQNFYCFRLGAFDPCNNEIVYSNIICSARFSATAQNNQNDLVWSTHTSGISDFIIIRNNTIISNAFGSPFIDNAVTCQTNYCYQVQSNYINGSRSLSMPVCVTALSTDIPTAITDATAVVTSTGVDITWQQDPAFQPVEYNIYRKEGMGSFQLIDKTAVPAYTDNEYNAESNFCYQVDYTDVCGNPAPMGIEICLIRLSGQLTQENHTQLAWTSYTGWTGGVSEYIIEKYSEQGQLLQTFMVGPGATTFTDTEVLQDQQIVRYVVKANPNTPGLGQAVSNEIIIIKEPRIFYPTAFTPDNQGPVENEVFRVFGQYIARFEMQIFNRWGELIFVSNDIDFGWDGTYNGQEVPDGTYAFIARLTDLTGHRFTRTGSVILLRKK